jgi:hypothetical protein
MYVCMYVGYAGRWVQHLHFPGRDRRTGMKFTYIPISVYLNHTYAYIQYIHIYTYIYTYIHAHVGQAGEALPVQLAAATEGPAQRGRQEEGHQEAAALHQDLQQRRRGEKDRKISYPHFPYIHMMSSI